MASTYTSPSITASGTTWSQLKGRGLSGALDGLIAAQPQPGTPNSAPTVAATATATGGGATGGLLAAGTYYFVVAETNGIGETTLGPESAQLTVASTNIPRVTFQTLKSGNTARNLYVGALGGSTGGPYTLYARGITAGTFDMAVAVPTDSSTVAPPTANTTALSTKQIDLLRSLKYGNLQQVIDHAASVLRDYLQSDPIPHDRMLKHWGEAHVAVAALNTLFSEIGTLLVTNPGSLTTAAWGAGLTRSVRTLP
jgi:hypothetical protein